MRNISVVYDKQLNKEHDNGESCSVYLHFEFLNSGFKLLAHLSVFYYSIHRHEITYS